MNHLDNIKVGDLARMKADRLAHSERAVKAVDALKALGFTEDGDAA